MFAVRDEQARLRLAAIHDDIVVDDPAFDRQLIAGLAAQGEIGLAREVYGRADKARDARRRKEEVLSWAGDYPPFDWAFTDRRNIRAKPNAAGDDLEIYVRPGGGGVIAQRLVTLAEAKRGFSIEVDSTRPIRAGRMRATLYCGQSKEPAAQIDLSKGDNTLTLPELNEEGCAALRLELYARAFRGEPVLRSRIGQITLG